MKHQSFLGKNYYFVLIAYILSMFGDWVFKLAVPVILYQITGSALWMSVGYGVSFVPYVLIMPLMGVVGDRFKRQKVLWLGDFLSAVICFLMAVYLLGGGENPYVIVFLLFGLGCVEATYHPAFQGFIPSVAPASSLVRANSYFSMSNSLLQFVGPLISGVVISILGANIITLTNGFTFLLSFYLIWVVKPLVPEKLELGFKWRDIFRDFERGFRVFVRQPVIKWLTFLFILLCFSETLIMGNLIYFLTVILDYPVKEAGLMIGLSALGAVVGAAITPWLSKRILPGRLILGCSLISALGTGSLLYAEDLGAWLIVLGRGIDLAGESIIVVTVFSLRQKVIPNRYLSRTVAISRAISFIPIPIAAVVGGYLLETTGGKMGVLIAMSVGVSALFFLIGLFSPLVSPEAHEPLEDPDKE